MTDRSAHATLVFDGDDRVVAGNDAATVVLGQPVAAVTGATLDELVADGVLASEAVDAYRDAVEQGADSFRAPIVSARGASAQEYEVLLEPGEGDEQIWTLTDAGRSSREADTVTALHDATRELIRADSREAVLETCANVASRVLGFPATGVRAYDDTEEVLEHVAFGGTVNDIDTRPPVGLEGTPHGEAFRATETLVEDISEDDDLYEDSMLSFTMYVPIDPYGLLSVGTFGERFDETDVRLAEILTENTAAALRQVEQRERLQQQNERLAEFAGVVAHDLRNPLAVATGSLAQYRETGDETFGDRAADALDRMDRIVDDVLELARGEDEVADPTPVSLAGCARDAWANVPTKDTDLSLDTDERISGDRGRLLRLFENCFRNAVEHGDADKVVVESTDDGFAIADDGTGFGDVDDPFDAGVTSSDAGSGLGLAIVADVARAHGFEPRVADGDASGARIKFVRGHQSP